MGKEITPDKWIWYGYPAHFICASRCAFRMATKVGRYIVSTVGDMRDDRGDATSQTIGHDRTYETMVFARSHKCREEGCGCGQYRIDPSSEVEMVPANDAATARKNHMATCRKYAKGGGPC